MIVVLVRDNSCEMVTVKVSLIDLKEIRECIVHIALQVLQTHCVPGEACEFWSHDIVHRETLYPIMCGQVRLKIANMIQHAHV